MQWFDLNIVTDITLGIIVFIQGYYISRIEKRLDKLEKELNNDK